jgi:hypothetical protein
MFQCEFKDIRRSMPWKVTYLPISPYALEGHPGRSPLP